MSTATVTPSLVDTQRPRILRAITSCICLQDKNQSMSLTGNPLLNGN